MSLLIKNVFLDGKKQDILIEGEKIKKISSKLEIRTKEKIDGKGAKAVLPFLINGHTHAAMSLLRGHGDDLSLKNWLEKKIWPIEAKMTEDDVYWGTKLACLEMIKTGTGFFNEMYMFPHVVIRAIEEMGIKALVGMVMIDVFPTKDSFYVEKTYLKLKSQQTNLVKLSISPHAIYTVSKNNLIWAKDFAQKNNLIIHTHISETQKEVKDCLKKYGLLPVEFLDKIGFLSSKTILAHGVWLSDREIKILSKRKCSLVYNPCSNMKLATGNIFPYKKLKKAGVNIILGTDSSASNNNLDMFEEMKIASLVQKHREQDPTVFSSQEVIQCATLNGAKAFNLNSGEIKEGKLADLILIDLNSISLIPGHNILSDIVYSASGNVVSDLLCNGKIIMRDRKVKEEDKIIKHARKKAQKLAFKK